jgi:carbonic anhydrase
MADGTQKPTSPDEQSELDALNQKSELDVLKEKFPKAISPDTALTWLEHGNTRFVKRHFRNDGLSAKDRERLSTGQHPHTIVLACSDSRVPPEHIFDQALGEIFVIRVAGEALDPAVVGSLEYAVGQLGTRLILVLGHESCGAIEAAANTRDGQSTGSASLDKLVADIRPRLGDLSLRQPASQGYVEESTANVRGVMKDLLLRSPLLKKFSDAGWLEIRGGLYRLASGQVDFLK